MSADPFREEWFGEASQTVLARLARSVADVDGLIVEVGSWTGRSTCALAKAIYPRTVQAVDTWCGSPGEISAELADERDVFAEWSANVQGFTRGNVVAHRMGWRDYVATLDEPVALLFIDAEHTEKEVRENIQAFLPLIAPGGVLCGDDIGHPPVQAGIKAALPEDEVFVEATVWFWRKPVDELERLYREQCATPSDIYMHLPRMVEIVESLNARHVIELGTRTGVSTLAWLHALRGTQGRLTSVDIDGRPPIGEYDHWTFIQGDDLVVAADLEPADVVFIDTSHTLAQTRQELNVYRWLVKPGGVMCLHDTELRHPEDSPRSDPPFPVKVAVEEFVAENGFEWTNFTDNNGFGLIKIP
jgi:predicted O-methyltransferase YrrM